MGDHHEHHDPAPTDANRDAGKDSQQTNEAFESLVLRYLDGLHTEEELQRLDELLSSRPDCREAFAAISLEGGVLNEISFACPVDKSKRTPGGQSFAGCAGVFGYAGGISTESSDSSLAAAWSGGGDQPTENGFPPSGFHLLTWLAVAPTRIVVAATTGIVLLIAVGWLGWTAGGNDAKRRLNRETPIVLGGAMSAVEIESGTARLKLPGIGDVVLDGPAKFEMIDAMRARLSEGRARVRVTEESGHGFTVETPDGNVIDLGTEFGLEVGSNGATSLVVFDGSVDLERPSNGISNVQRLVRGEGVTYRIGGETDRIMSILTGRTSTFERGGHFARSGNAPIIVDVADNIDDPSVRTFYEIVSGGFREDALAYVDREAHEWNGWTKRGMPSYLLGADYVKMFADDKLRQDIEISVTVSCPAKLYVFHRDRIPDPDWLSRGFRDTGDKIGLDVAPWKSAGHQRGKGKYRRGEGPGNEVDFRFTVWERVVDAPGVVRFGRNTTYATQSGMYGIAAVRLPIAEPPKQVERQVGETANSVNPQVDTSVSVVDPEGERSGGS